MSSEYIEANRAAWDERVAAHLISYEAEKFADDPDAISGDEDLTLLAPHLPNGSVAGLDLLHLQCHIGVDSISWARLGAYVTGTDFSGEAIAAARELARRAGVTAEFVQTSNEDAPSVLRRQFDVVVTSVGVINWLPELRSWAEAIFALLRPGGVFLVRDGHPMMTAMDYERTDGLLVAAHPYFVTGEPLADDSGESYTGDKNVESTVVYNWPHSLSEVIGSLLRAGLVIESFDEQTTIPWQALPILERGPDGYVLPSSPERMPLMFSVVARRPA